MARLNGWQRLGIVISMVWAAVVLVLVAASDHNGTFYSCLFALGPDTGDEAACAARRNLGGIDPDPSCPSSNPR